MGEWTPVVQAVSIIPSDTGNPIQTAYISEANTFADAVVVQLSLADGMERFVAFDPEHLLGVAVNLINVLGPLVGSPEDP